MGALIQIHSLDVVGVLADVSAALADMKVSILSVNTQKASGGRAIMNTEGQLQERGSLQFHRQPPAFAGERGGRCARLFTGSAKGGDKAGE